MTASPPLFDLAALGTLPAAFMGAYFFGGFVLFILSFSKRHGRSRWPLHLLFATAIICTGTGMVKAGLDAVFFGLEALKTGGPVDSAKLTGFFLDSMTSIVLFGGISLFLGLLAFSRAIYGMVKEPGPRF